MPETGTLAKPTDHRVPILQNSKKRQKTRAIRGQTSFLLVLPVVVLLRVVVLPFVVLFDHDTFTSSFV